MPIRRKILFAFFALSLLLLFAEGVFQVAHLIWGRVSLYAYDPVVGHTYLPELDTDSRGYRVKTDALGTPSLQQRDLLTDIDVVVSGDSFPAGHVASWPAGAVEVATRILLDERPQLGVLNLAVPGFGTDQAWLRYREHGPQKPSVVVYMLFHNDLQDNILSFNNSRTKPRFVLDGDRLEQVARPWFTDLFLQHSGIAKVLALVRLRLTANPMKTTSPEERSRLALALINAWATEVRGQGSDFIVVAHHRADMNRQPEDFQLLIAGLRKDQIELYVLNEIIDLSKLELPDGTHWNESGHAEVAKLLSQIIDRALRRRAQ